MECIGNLVVYNILYCVRRELGHNDLLIFQSIAKDVGHVLVEALKAAITWPHIGVVGGHQTLDCGLQTRE